MAFTAVKFNLALILHGPLDKPGPAVRTAQPYLPPQIGGGGAQRSIRCPYEKLGLMLLRMQR